MDVAVLEVTTGRNKTTNSTIIVGSEPAEEERMDNKNLVKEKSKGSIRQNFFSQRVVEPWNILPSSVKNAVDVNSFKNLYDSWKK